MILKASAKDFNIINGVINGYYHEAALKLGISDAEMNVLYVLGYEGSGCYQSLLYKNTGLTRSTVNTIIRRFEKQELLYLEKGKGRNTCVILTTKGEEHLKNTSQKIVDIENHIFMNWTEEERITFLKLNQKYAAELKNEIDKMEGK